MAVSPVKTDEIPPAPAEEPYKTCTPGVSPPARSSTEKEELFARLASVLIIRSDSTVIAPVVTLQGERANIYPLLEKHVRSEYHLGGEKFWRLVKGLFQPNLENWRPRVNGIQLKALQGARLPDSDSEWEVVRERLEELAHSLQPPSTPELVVKDLKDLVAYCEEWWDNRTKRESAKRPADGAVVQAAKRVMVGLLPEVLPGQVAAYTVPVGHNGGYLDLMNVDAAAQLQEGIGQNNGGGTANGEAPSKPKTQATGLDKLIVTLNVGGHRFPTTCATLAAVEGSYLWKLATTTSSSATRTVSGEFFIDRNGKYFEYVLEYLRAARFGEEHFVLPTDAEQLQSLLRESVFYKLPGLEERIKADLKQTKMDSFYIETGYHDMNDGHVMYQHQAQVMKELNNWVETRVGEGYIVDSIENGVHHQVGENGHRLNNLYYHVLFKRVPARAFKTEG